jgi:hypothetical protein
MAEALNEEDAIMILRFYLSLWPFFSYGVE